MAEADPTSGVRPAWREIVLSARPLAERAGGVVLAYGLAAVAILACVLLLRRALSPSDLKASLAYIFIASVSAGLEPGTVKAAALAGLEQGAPNAAEPRSILAAGAVKGLAAAPFLALAWRFADPAAPWAALCLTPAVAFAGFAATDLRVLLDLKGRHVRAVGLKQGSLAGGVVLFTLLRLAGSPLLWAVAAASFGRILLAVTLAPRQGGAAPAASLPARVAALLRDVRWAELAGASVLGALGGSADRLLGLRFLPAGTYAGYYIVSEAFSRFWLLPYLLGPIIFARVAAGLSPAALMAGIWRVTAAAGAAFLLAVALALVAAPALLAKLLGGPPSGALLAFALAVVISAIVQLRLHVLQGQGRVRLTLGVAIASAVVSWGVFLFFLGRYGVQGLFWGWLAKSTFELVLVTVLVRGAGPRRSDGSTGIGSRARRSRL